MSDEEVNSAELQAEEILKDAYAEARAEDCPQGAECPVHFRVNEEYFDKPIEYARLIDYVGDFVVITEDNHELEDPSIILAILLGQMQKEDLPARWSTLIFKVGEGVIGDLSVMDVKMKREALRYARTHDNWDDISVQHVSVVLMLEEGMIDVSKPFDLEG